VIYRSNSNRVESSLVSYILLVLWSVAPITIPFYHFLTCISSGEGRGISTPRRLRKASRFSASSVSSCSTPRLDWARSLAQARHFFLGRLFKYSRQHSQLHLSYLPRAFSSHGLTAITTAEFNLIEEETQCSGSYQLYWYALCLVTSQLTMSTSTLKKVTDFSCRTCC